MLTVIALIVGVLGCIFGLIAIAAAHDDRPPRRGQQLIPTTPPPRVVDRAAPELPKRRPLTSMTPEPPDPVHPTMPDVTINLRVPKGDDAAFAEALRAHMPVILTKPVKPVTVYVDDVHAWRPPPGEQPRGGWLIIPRALAMQVPPEPYDDESQRAAFDKLLGIPVVKS